MAASALSLALEDSCMANARMANSDHDSDLYVSFRPIDAPGAPLGTMPPSALRIVDLDSSEPFELPAETPPAATAFKPGEASDNTPSGLAAGQLWLNGGVLMCACPDCHAPMSIRFWLMIADCWQCGTSIELTEEQEREAKLKVLRRAAKQGFDEIDQGSGIVLKGKKALDQFFNEIEREVLAKPTDNGI